MASPQVTFRLTDELGPEVDSRTVVGGRTATVKRDLERYYWLVNSLTPSLDANEAALVYDALLSFSGHLHSIQYVWAEVSEQVASQRLDERWGVEAQSLVDRLRLLTPAERLRLVDIMEQARIANNYLDFADDPRAWKVLFNSGLVPRLRYPPSPTAQTESSSTLDIENSPN